MIAITKAITLDLGGYKLTTTNGWGGLQLKNGCSVKNGTLLHTGRVNAIKAWDVVSLEDLVIEVTDTTEGKTVGGIAIQENAAGIDTIKNVTLKGVGLDYGIETYNGGNAQVIGTMENVNIDAVGTGLLLSAPCGTATNCTIKGGVSGIDMLLKGTYSVSIDLVNCTVEGGEQAVYAHDEQKGYTYDGSIKLTADEETDFVNANGIYLKEEIASTTSADIDDVRNYKVTFISNVEELLAFAQAVNAGNTFKGETVKLTADLDFNGGAWLEIDENGTVVTDFRIPNFAGTFDGQDHVIKNFKFTVSKSGDHRAMMFSGTLTGIVKNLKVENVTATIAGGTTRVAAVANTISATSATNARLDNVHVKNFTVNCDNLTTDQTWFGALSVYTNGGNLAIKDCSVTDFTLNANSVYMGSAVSSCITPNNDFVNVTVTNFTANIDTVNGVFGGFAGQTQSGGTNASFTNCHVIGLDVDIKEITGDNVGGFMSTIGAATQFYNCSTQGTIDVTEDTLTTKSVGGFIGDHGWNGMYGADRQHEFENCVADVDITAVSANVGGFIGNSTIAGHPERHIPAYFVGCEAKGDVKTTNGAAGGFVGQGDRGLFTDCSASGNVTGNIAGGFWGYIYPKTKAEAMGSTHKDPLSKSILLDGCVATGTVEGTAYEAGLIGFMKDVYVNANNELGYATPVILSGNTPNDYNRFDYSEYGETPDITVYVATVNDQGYKTLAEAIAAANAIDGGATVTLLADVTLGEMLTISGNVTITGKTITWADGYNGTLFNVETGASLTLKDVTIDGENAFTFYNDTTTVEDDQNWYTRFVDVGEEDKAINDNVIVNAGNLTLDSVRITGVTIASDGDNGKTANTETGGYYLMYNDDLAIIKSTGGKVSILDSNIEGNAGMILNADNTITTLTNTKVEYNMGCGRNGGLIDLVGGTFTATDSSICYNKAMARCATVIGVTTGAVAKIVDTKIEYNKHLGVGSNTAGSMIVVRENSSFIMEGDSSISYNEGGRAGAIASRFGTADADIQLVSGTITGNTASNDSWNGASVFLRTPATIGEGMKVDGTIAVNAAPGALEITGGEFNGSLTVADGLTAVISGGTFNYDPSEWLAPNVGLVYDEATGTYGTTKDLYEYNRVKYQTFDKVLEAIEADSKPGFGGINATPPVVKVLASHKIDKFITIDTTLTLNLNGQTITRDGGTGLYINGTDIVVTIKGEGTVQSSAQALYIDAGTVKIENGTFKSTVNQGPAVYVINNGHAEIYGGTFSNANGEFVLNEKDETRDATTITVYGGTFVGFDPANNAAEGAGTNFVAEGYVSVANGANFTVVRGSEKVLEIWDVDDLMTFAALANSGNNFSGWTVNLMADIDLEWADWMAITSYATFNGNDHTISNLTYVPTENGRMGFFQSVGGPVSNLTLDGIKATVPADGRFGGFARYLNAPITNVTVKNIEVTTTDTLAWVGGFTSYTAGGSTDNCHVENFTVNATAGADLIGGFIALTSNRQLYQNCTVKGFKVTVTDTHSSGCGVGGFVAQTQTGWNNPKFKNDTVTGIDIVASGLVDVGGFIAWPGAHTEYAINCHTQGVIDVTGVTSADCFAGGFFGNLGWNCDLGYMGHVVTDCSADVDIITKVASAGGFVGSATNSNNNSMYATFTNCSASGDITAVEGATADIGGFAGDADRGVYTDCSATGTVTNNGTGYAGGFIGYIEDTSPKYDGRYPAGTRDYLVDVQTFDNCTGSMDPFFGGVADTKPAGELINKQSYVASVGDVYYTNFDNALAAAKAGDVKTIVILAPVVITEDTTLDLTGLTLDGNGITPAFRVVDEATLTVKGGNFLNATGYLFILGASDGSSAGNVIIEDGSYEACITIASVTKGTLIVLGGEFKIAESEYDATYLLNCIDANYKDGSASIIVKGGRFYGFNPEDNAAEGAGTNFVAQNYKSFDNGDGSYTVKNYIEWIKAALLAGNSVTLDRDIVVDGSMIESIPAPTNGNGKYPNYGIFNVVGDYDVTFDLNGHSITYNGHESFVWNGKTYNSCTVAHGVFFANAGADLTVKDSVGTGSVTVYGLASGAYVASPDTTFTITGGTWKNEGCATCGGTNIFLYPLQGGELYIKGGHFDQALDATGESYLIVEHGGSYANSVIDYSKTKVVISGGTFVGMNPEEIKYFNQTADNKLDTTTKPSTNGCELGYMANDNGDGTYGIKEWDLVIRNADDLLRFVAMANAGNNFSGKTVTLMADINLGGMTWTPIKNFLGTFNGNKHTISNFHLDATKSHAGFFYKIDFGNGTAIKDLTLSDITATVGNYYVGALAYFSFAVQDNITIKNFDVTTVSSEANIGGYAGWVEWGHIRNCTIENMTVHAENGAGLIGGLAAVLKADNWLQYNNIDVNGFKVTINDTDGKYAEVGGLVGQTQTGHDAPVFTNCDITGIDVTASGLVTVGGFIARPGAHTTATNCTTEGKIDVTGVTSSDESAGGFFGNLGWNNNESSRGGHKLTNCSADVDIITKIAPAGGFVGSATNEQNRNMAVAFTNCKALGTITCDEGGTAYIGGFAGDADRGTYKNCSAAQDPFIGHVYAGSKLINEGSYVASVGSVYYTNFDNALAAAKAGDVKTIVILAPVVITEDTTLDLTGLTLDGNGITPAFRVVDEATLTVKGGNFLNATGYLFILGASDGSSAGNVIIEDGSYEACITIASVTKGTLIVLGGEFKIAESEYDATYLLNCIDANYKDGSASIIVKGGRFYGFNPEDNAAEGAGTNFVAQYYESVGNDDGSWTVQKKTLAILTFEGWGGTVEVLYPSDQAETLQDLVDYYLILNGFTGADYNPVITLYGDVDDTITFTNKDAYGDSYKSADWTLVHNGFTVSNIKVADGYKLIDNGNGTYTATPYVKWVQAELFAGNDVTLEQDIVITDYDLVHAHEWPSNGNGKYTEVHGNGAIFHIIKPGVDLDLNGHSIIWDAHHDDYCNARQVSLFMVTITGIAGETSGLTVKDSVGTGKVEVYGMGTGMYVVGVDATGTIAGGTWTNYPCKTCGASNIFLYPSHGGKLVITGGTFEQKDSEYLLGLKGSTKETTNNGVGVDYDATEVVISGGTFVGFNPENVKFFDYAGSDTAPETVNGCALGFVAKENADGTYGVEEWDLVIYDIDDLLRFAALVNAGNNFAGKTIVLGADIDLAGIEWAPIGGENVYFAGEFDGNGKTIENLTQTTGARMGLFGLVEKAYIHDLTMKNVTFEVNEDNARVGAIAGNLQYWNVVEDVTIDGINITIDGNNGLVGSVAGYVWKSQLGNVDVKNAVVTINGTGNVFGGHTAYGRAHVWDTNVTGNNAHWLDGSVQTIDGTEYVLQNYFVDCDVDGIVIEIIGKDNEVGGFFGSDTYNSHSNYFVNCHVTELEVNVAAGTSQIVGGFIAWNNGTTSAGTVKGFDGCSVSGTIKGADGIYGGFVGQVGGRACEYYNASANVNITCTGIAGGFVGATQAYSTHKYTFTNCVANGNVSASVAGGFAGKNGMSGDGKSVFVTYENCSANGTVFATSIAGGFIGEVNTELPATNWNTVDSTGDLTLKNNMASVNVTGNTTVGYLIGYLDGVANGDAKEGNTLELHLQGNTPDGSDVGTGTGHHINISGDTIVDDVIDYVASITDSNGVTYFATFQAAINAATEGKTITIIANDVVIDIDITKNVIVKKGDNNVTVTGKLYAGTYDWDVNEYCAETHYAKKDGEKAWTVVEKFKFTFSSANLGNNLSINFAFPQSPFADWSGFYVEFTRYYTDDGTSETERVAFDKWTKEYIDVTGNKDYVAHYVVSYSGIFATEMIDEVTAIVYDANGNAVSMARTDSIVSYVGRALSKYSDDEAQRTLLVDMLNYGAAAQVEFGYAPEKLANAGLTLEQQSWATTKDPVVEDSHVGDEHFVATNLILENNIALMFAFRDIDQSMKAVITYTDHYGDAHTVEISGSEFTSNNKYWVVTLEQLVVADARQVITCKIIDAEGNVVSTVTETVASYVARRLETADPTLTQLLKAFMKFSDSAYKFLH